MFLCVKSAKIAVMSEKIHLQGLTKDELIEFVASHDEPKYRAKQIFGALHARRVREFDEITDLPKAFREKLGAVAEILARRGLPPGILREQQQPALLPRGGSAQGCQAAQVLRRAAQEVDS